MNRQGRGSPQFAAASRRGVAFDGPALAGVILIRVGVAGSVEAGL